MAPQFEETHNMPRYRILRWVGAGVAVAVGQFWAYYGLLILADLLHPNAPAWWVMPILFSAFMGWLIVHMGLRQRRWQLTVGEGNLQVGYSSFRPTIPTSEIACVTAEEITKKTHGDWGIYTKAGASCYIAGHGPGVRIRTVSKRGLVQEYVFSTDDPAALARALGKELLPEPPRMP